MQSEVSSAQQPCTVVDPAPEKHPCLDCGVEISHRRRDAQRCEPCSYLRAKERAKNHYQVNRSAKLRYAKNLQQTPEAKRLRQKWEERNPEKLLEYRQRQKQKHREKTGYNPEDRTCGDCNVDISRRGHNAKKCLPCSSPPPRTCIVCDNDIGKRGTSRFCSEDCKQRHQQSKELQGYTKTCTKCNETKEHTEFGLHYGLRRPVCKSCEAKAVRDYSRALPREERQRRRRIQGQRERQKRANLPPEQKAQLRAKRRNAYRQKRYGIDEDEWYLKQEDKCAICNVPIALEDTEVDHDHKTKKPRALLCKNCNFKLLPRYEKFPQQHQDSPHLNLYLLQGRQQ